MLRSQNSLKTQEEYFKMCTIPQKKKSVILTKILTIVLVRKLLKRLLNKEQSSRSNLYKPTMKISKIVRIPKYYHNLSARDMSQQNKVSNE